MRISRIAILFSPGLSLLNGESLLQFHISYHFSYHYVSLPVIKRHS
ncbi:hypothetical protein GCWU000342_00598 [Shuttleworthella satelles DSM 14600]|uniref:Uncharacterized protein n=1 Tax=Shuttleworthella satelles DSM 14600 TaxID=626523 RepID=C4G9E6_9FIRM|nr:hypothetical protein GCWU000342_00598 [Shuttleworthia satelles DSM 14600]